MMNLRNQCVGLGLAALLCASVRAEDRIASRLPPVSSRKGVTFQKDIQPIFQASCVKCHDGAKPKGKLRLDSLRGVLDGSQDGDVVEPGKSARSILVINVAHLGDKRDWMPPPDNKFKIQPLTKEQIGLIRAWIDQGAK